MRAAYYRTCPDCGAHLDPDEKCDCEKGESNVGFDPLEEAV